MSSDLIRLKEALKASIEGMTPQDMARKPASVAPQRNAEGNQPKEKWSAAEILEHLDRTYTGSSKAFEQCLAEKKPSATKATLKDQVSALAVLGFGYLPEGRQAPKYTLPKGLSPTALPALIDQHLAKLEDVITQCETLFGEKTKLMNHPFLGPLSGKQWRKFHLVHGRHHIKQIKALRAGLQ